jgi:hypothetical protein
VAGLGYRAVASRSIVGRAVGHGSLGVPQRRLDTLLRSLRDTATT